jgi:hypothetical protein
MNRKLGVILQKVVSIQTALVRFRDEKGQHSIQVKIAFSSDNSLHCMISGDMPKTKLNNKAVHLVQKSHDDYFFISGTLKEVQANSKILTFNIIKACWFVRKKRGDVTWFSEKCMHEVEQVEMRPAS